MRNRKRTRKMRPRADREATSRGGIGGEVGEDGSIEKPEPTLDRSIDWTWARRVPLPMLESLPIVDSSGEKGEMRVVRW
jgi:hypothetical protein